MRGFVTLSLLSCAGNLEITDEADRFTRAHCGREHLVNRGGAVVILNPVVAELQEIQWGTGRTASELAMKRLEPDLPATYH